MEQTFKIKYKITPVSEQCVPPMVDFKGDKRTDVIYEGSTAYVPRRLEGGHILRYSVYFWTSRSYWKYINDCAVDTFEKIIKPRIIKDYGESGTILSKMSQMWRNRKSSRKLRLE